MPYLEHLDLGPVDGQASEMTPTSYRPAVPGVEEILFAQAGPAVELVIDRPAKRNAMTGGMWRALGLALTERVRDARVVLLSGRPGAFCAGADLADPVSLSGHPFLRMQEASEVVRALAQLPCPSLAVVEGPASGAGFSLAMACDLVICSSSATFIPSFSSRGLSVDLGGSFFLPRLVGWRRAQEIALLGEPIDALSALEAGLVNRLADGVELVQLVGSWGSRLAAGPPVATRQTRRLLLAGAHSSLAEVLEREDAAQAVNLMGEEAAEGFSAYLERRPPHFMS
jgi:2-(1,2-epoxy-1,2-dihydrophenyl)acetyl-CoA isomerase